MNAKELRGLALHGAKRRIEELHAEIERIRAAFPGEFGLRGGAKKPRTRKRRKMSAAAKKAISDRMKKYWAARRKKKG